MKKHIVILIVLLISNSLFAQEFEGFVRYGLSYKSNIIKKTSNRLKPLDSAIVAYKKDNRFVKYHYKPYVINVYDGKTPLLFVIEKGEKTIMTSKTPENNYRSKNKPEIIKSDSIFKINNLECKKVEFIYSYYKSIVYYNDDEKYDGMGKLFFYGSFIDMDIKTSFIRDYIVVRYIQEFGDTSSTIDLLDLKSIKIDSTIFTVPKFKKSRKYIYDDDKFQVYKKVDKEYQFPNLRELHK